MVVLLTALS